MVKVRVVPVVLIFVSLCVSCSGKSDLKSVTSPDLNVSEQTEQSLPKGTYLAGIWDVVVDPVSGKIDAMPLRGTDAAFNVTTFIDAAPFNLYFENLEFDTSDPEYNFLSVDIGIHHPLNNSKFTAFDVLGVIMCDAEYAYLGQQVLRVPRDSDLKVINPDGYTRWFNYGEFKDAGANNPLLGYTPSMLGNLDEPWAQVNPYRYYADDLGPNDHTLDWLINHPGSRGEFSPGETNYRNWQLRIKKGELKFQYMVIAHWLPPEGDGPYTPDDFPPSANMTECPVISVDNVEASFSLSDDNTLAGHLSFDLAIWDRFEDFSDTNDDLFKIRYFFGDWWGSTHLLDPIEIGEHYEIYRFEKQFFGVPVTDELDVWVRVRYPDWGEWLPFVANDSLATYYNFDVPVDAEPANFLLENITPSLINSRPNDLCVVGNYCFAVDTRQHLYVLDISNPTDVSLVQEVILPLFSGQNIEVRDEYAYITAWNGGLMIFDIDPPEETNLKGWVIDSTPYAGTGDIELLGDYAYICTNTSYNDIRVFDISNPESPTLAGVIQAPDKVYNMEFFADGGNTYILVGSRESQIYVLKMDGPISATYVHTIDILYKSEDILVKDGFLYVSEKDSLVEVSKLDPIMEANVDHSVATSGRPQDLYLNGNLLYVSNVNGMHDIIDISDPLASSVVASFLLEREGWLRQVADGKAYWCGKNSGISVADVQPDGSLNLIGGLGNLDSIYDLLYLDNVIYCIGAHDDILNAVDVTEPTSAEIIQSIYAEPLGNFMGRYESIKASPNRLYVNGAKESDFFHIYAVDNDGLVTMTGSIDIPVNARGFALDAGHLYSYNTEFSSVEIYSLADPDSPQLEQVVGFVSGVTAMEVVNGYLFSDTADFSIMDVDPVSEAHLVEHDLILGEAIHSLVISNGMAYAGGSSGIFIIDISDPESPVLVEKLTIPTVLSISVANGYAYVVNDKSELYIYDVDPPGDAHIVAGKELYNHDSSSPSFLVDGNYGYTGVGEGLNIWKLW